jgi:DNA-binding IclR family transcriptional regulator
MPAARLQALEFLLTRDEATTTDVATELGLPNPTTHRTLGDLAAHGVIERESQGQGKADLWRIQAWAAERYRAAATTTSEMSDPPL